MPFVQTAGPALERKGDIAAFLTSLEPRSVFFVDEIHRLPRALEETFYPAMEDRRLPITVGQGAGARVVTLELPPFTLIGATTRAGLLTTPLRDRFGIQARLEPYAVEELARIVARAARHPRGRARRRGRAAIAARSRGTPRVANRLLKRVRDFAEVRMRGHRHGARPRRRRWRCSRSTSWASTGSIARSCGRSASSSRAVPSGCRRSPSRSARSRTRSRTCTSRICCSVGLIKRTPRGRAATADAFAHIGLRGSRRRGRGAVLKRPRRAVAWPAGSLDACACEAVVCIRSMAHPFICPNCGHRTTEVDRYIGFRRQPKGCANCGFSFLFELLDDYYPAPDAAFFVADREGRVIGCGSDSFALTGLEEEEVIGQRSQRRSA